MFRLRPYPALLGITLPLLLAGCGLGTAGVVAASGGSSSGGGPPTITRFEITAPKVSPAPVFLEASEPMVVRLFLSVVDSDPQPLEGLAGSGVEGNQVPLPLSDLSWEFTADLPAKEGYTEDVTLRVEDLNGAAIQGGNLNLGMGNDPPVVESIVPLTEDGMPFSNPDDQASGNVEVILGLSDTSEDVVALEVEWRRSSDAPDDWKSASVGGLPAGVATERSPSFFSVFWQTTANELGAADDEFVLRVEADDGVDAGFLVSSGFRVDNNDEPIVQLDGLSLGSNPDDRRGIPIPYKAIDPEGDSVRVLFQWRHASQAGFPDLGTQDPDELLRRIDDATFVREKQICTPFPSHARGHAFAVDATRVRLPELVQGESRVLATGIAFDSLDVQLLRAGPELSPLAATWPTNPLRAPAAALPSGGGETAIVLDAVGNTAELLEVHLATGQVVRTLASSLQGAPSAMAFEPGRGSVLVATDSGGSWQLYRVELETGLTTPLLAAGVGGATRPAGPLRAILSLGDDIGLATAEDALWLLDWSVGSTPLRPVKGNLGTPWGLALDPRHAGRVLVAERDLPAAGGGRVLSVDLATYTAEPLQPTPRSVGEPAFPSPTALAVDRDGTLLVVCAPPPAGAPALHGLNLGRAGDNQVYSLGGLADDAASVATGPGRLRLVALPASADLAAAGGVEQTRALVAFDPATATATVARDFDPAVRHLQPWRIALGRPFRDPVRGSATGTRGVFVWNSADVEVRGGVFLRALGFDNEPGVAAETAIPRDLGRFADTLSLPTGNQPFGLAAEDLDGDGDLDLVTANTFSDNLTVFFQDGQRTFTELPPLPAGNRPSSVAAADLDNDDDLDLVCASSGSNALIVFFQDAPRTFVAQPPLPAGSFPAGVAAADLDRDGRLDLVCTNIFSNDLMVFYQDAARTFTAVDPLPAGRGPESVVAADLDADGKLDLACASLASHNVRVFFQDAPRSFTAQPAIRVGRSPESLTAVDLDGDGDLDLVSANVSSDDLTVLFQDAPRSFTALPPIPAGSFADAVAAADLDGDGDVDLVSGNGGSNDLTVFLQEAPRDFVAQPPLAAGTAPAALAIADVDGDGGFDLVSANGNSNDLTVHFQDTARRFRPGPPLSAGNKPAAATAADLDGDGDLDVVAANEGLFPNPGNLTVFFQDGPRTFTALPPLATNLGAVSVAAADLDGDGNLDLVSANGSRNDLWVFFQDAPRTFTPQFRLFTGRYPASVAAADLDGDGDLDLISANRSSDDLTVYIQDAPRVFNALPQVPTGSAPASVAAADLDGDGDLDLVSANLGSNDLTVLFQDAPLAFSRQPPLSAGIGPVSIAAADLDGDGDLDLVCANQISSDVMVWFQDAPRTFTLQPPLAAGLGPVSVAAADLDGDGDLDLVSANGTSRDLTVWSQETPRVFTAQPRLPSADLPTSVVAADLDGDGDVDLVLAAGAPTVLWGR